MVEIGNGAGDYERQTYFTYFSKSVVKKNVILTGR